ncbi:MAG: hypothetical protein HC923_11975 [Myxococcales bacterium]|nr:hypothetical protein [Myxococcales bacterium]
MAPTEGPSSRRSRSLQTLGPALLGAALGYLIGELRGAGDLDPILLPLHAVMGAIGGILCFRVLLIAREVWNDFRSGR